MNYLEKMLFIDLTCYQLGITDTRHPDFIATWDSLSNEEKNQYAKLTNEIHQIWTYINMPLMVDIKKRVNSVFKYNEIIQPVDKRILTVCSDYEITLNEEFTEEFKATAKRVLGKDYFNWFEN
jgi:hypothetical protein